MGAAVIVLGWPAAILWPNGSKGAHWSRISTARKLARSEAAWMAKLAAITPPPDGPIHLRIEGYPTPRSRPDADGLQAALKPHLDGIADALAVNDRRFVPHTKVMPYDREKAGTVHIRIVEPAARILVTLPSGAQAWVDPENLEIAG